MKDDEEFGDKVGEAGPFVSPLQLIPPVHIHDDNPLNDEQQQRAAALYCARSVLERRGGGPFGGNGNAEVPPSVPDLFRVAEFILTGQRLDAAGRRQ